MSSGPRAGQRVMEQTTTRLIQKGVRFTGMRSDKAFCGPSRASLFTGLNTNNHGVSNNETASYYPFMREGTLGSRDNGGTNDHWFGPWERDLALRAGFGGVPVAASAQGGPVGQTRNRRNSQTLRGDSTNDDLQAFTGSLPTWLASAGITCALIGKYTNALGIADGTFTGFNGVGYVNDTTVAAISANGAWTTSQAATQGVDPVVALTNRYVPPGWSYWRCLAGDNSGGTPSYSGGAQDHYAVLVSRYTGPNSAVGDGVSNQAFDGYVYKHSVTLTRVGSVAHVQFTAHGLNPGDEIAINNTGAGADNALWTGTTLTVASVVDADNFTYNFAGATPTGATPGSTPQCYPRKYYGESVWAKAASDFITSRGETEPWFMYYAPDNPHIGIVDGSNDSSVEAEQRYIGTLSGANAFTFNGLPQWSPDKTGPCTIPVGGTPSRTITSATRRLDGSGPFDQNDIGKLVNDLTYATVTNAHVVSVAADLPGGTGGSFVIDADPVIGLSGGSSVLASTCIGTQITTLSEITTGRQQAWERRQEMLASVDDTIGVFLDAVDARGWKNVTLILTSDNGWQQGEMNSRENNAAPSGGGPAIVNDMWNSKVMAWEGSVRSMLFVYHPPFWATNAIEHFPVSHYDLAPTILDFFSGLFPALGTHHVHTKRDGVSIVRLLADPTLAWSRAQLIERGNFDQGMYTTKALSDANNQGEAIIVGHRKYIRHLPGNSGAARLYDVRNDDLGYTDYEATDLAPTSGAEVTVLDGRLNNLRTGRWLASSSVQSFRTA